jgi:hypothetical protein
MIAILSVRRVGADESATCRRCGQQLARGRRVAIVTGTGNMCMRCVARGHSDGQPGESPSTPGAKREPGICEACGQAMVVLVAGQRRHPLCDDGQDPPR